MTFTTRPLDEDEFLSVLETLGDTPTLGLYRDGKLLAVGVQYVATDEDLPGLVRALNTPHTHGEAAP